MCRNCCKKSLNCSFTFLVPAVRRQQPSAQLSRRGAVTGPPSSLPSSISPVHGLLFCRENTLDFGLFCHFKTRMGRTFTDQISVEQAITTVIPNLSATYPFVGHGVLGVAYTHAARLSPHSANAAKLLAEAALHINRGLSDYLKALENVTHGNIAPLFAFALLIVMYTFISVSDEYDVLLSAAENTTAPDLSLVTSLSGLPVRVCRTVRGIFSLFWKFQSWIASSPIAPIIQRHTPPIATALQISWVQREDQELASLEHLWKGDSSIPQSSSCALSDTLQYLRETFTMATQLTMLSGSVLSEEAFAADLPDIHKKLASGRLDDLAIVFTWYIRIPPTFLHILEQGNSYAMVLLAHYAILLDRACSKRWWFRKLPSQFLATAEFVLGEERGSWIEWPLKVIGLGASS